MSEFPPPPPGDAPPPGPHESWQWSGGWQQQPWPAQPWGFAPPREHPQGTTVLVLGILSLVVCGLLGPFAWKTGNETLREMDAQPGVTWSNRGAVTVGRILGIVSSALVLLGAAFFLLWLVFAIAVFSSF